MSPLEIRIGTNLRRSWELFLKKPELFVGFTLLYWVCFTLFRFLPGISWLAGLLVPALYFPAFLATAVQVERGEKITAGLFQKSLERFPAMLLLLAVKYALIGFAGLLLLVPGVYLLVVYSFAECFCALEGKNFWESLEASRALVRGLWWKTLGLTGITLALNFLGVLFLLVGLLITMPWSFLLLYCVFQDLRAQQTSPGSAEALS